MEVILIFIVAILSTVLAVVLRVMSNAYKLSSNHTASKVCGIVSYVMCVIVGLSVGWLVGMLINRQMSEFSCINRGGVDFLVMENKPEYILCAAIHYDNGIKYFNNDELKYKYGWADDSLTRCETTQGFLTSKGRFVNREEALEIARAAGQVGDDAGYKKQLFSEDLY